MSLIISHQAHVHKLCGLVQTNEVNASWLWFGRLCHRSLPATIITDGKEAENPAFTYWVRQDQLLLLTILGSCDIDARTIISQAETSYQAWEQLRTTFANKSQSQVLHLKEQLSSMTKGTSTISKYLRSIKTIADELSLIGYPLDDIDLVLYCLSGLGPNFKDIATVLRT